MFLFETVLHAKVLLHPQHASARVCACASLNGAVSLKTLFVARSTISVLPRALPQPPASCLMWRIVVSSLGCLLFCWCFAGPSTAVVGM